MKYKIKLLDRAREASNNAYCPYSCFPVGAAVLTHDDTIFTGCNIENISYSLCLCAERSALASAVSAGYRKFKAIAVIGKKAKPCNPCGACLQFISEFGPIEILLENESGELISKTLNDFLPNAFETEVLKKAVN